MTDNVKIEETHTENTQQNVIKGGAKLGFFQMYINFCKKIQQKYKYATGTFIILLFGFLLYRTDFKKELNNITRYIKKN
jgi:hypothetical protein|tara:strand:+ start:27 stop:263 length:237 start_codon:yes stop_codon:yes gene_type:complete